MSKCFVCNEKSVHTCDKCRSVSYCSPECQRSDWKTHKIACGDLSIIKLTQETTGQKKKKEIDNKVVVSMADYNTRVNEARKLENPLEVIRHFNAIKDTPECQQLLREIGCFEETERRGWMGTMRLVFALKKHDKCTDENIVLLFGNPDYVRSVMIEAAGYAMDMR
ncbi:hypothetical protein B484DRAFT_328975 [Ochromonadaceae sp. CCMP2298]|nr:hypothetical protein B484DRAFT_328975 [Ochromonadaceae sp. CCMP2298]